MVLSKANQCSNDQHIEKDAQDLLHNFNWIHTE